jgi:hypothetical protein
MKNVFLPLVTLIVFLGGCVTPAHSIRVFEEYPSRSDYENIEVLESLPQREYTVVAEFETYGNSLASIRKQAARYGADAVFVASYSYYFTGATTELRNNSKQKKGLHNESLCTAIKYR